MSFLTPLFLLGGLAIAGPIIFHLVRRTSNERITFSSLLFLQPTPPKLTRRSRIEHWLLLLLRCLVLGLLALGFARPFLLDASRSLAGSGAVRQRVILLDTSASMQRAGVWTKAKQEVEKLLNEAKPTDFVALYTFDRQPHALMPFEQWRVTPDSERKATLAASLQALKPGWNSTHLGLALSTAAEALEEDAARNELKRLNIERDIVAVSDMQEGAKKDGLQGLPWPEGTTVQFVNPVTSPRSNAGLQIVAESEDTTVKSSAKDEVIRVRVSNARDSRKEQFKVGWTTPDGTQIQGVPVNVHVPAGQSRVVAVPRNRETAEADRILLTGDDDAFDNTVYVARLEPEHVPVVFLGDDDPADTKQLLYYVQRGLQSTRTLSLQVTGRSAKNFPSAAELAAARLIIVGQVLSSDQSAEVRRAVENGSTVLFAMKDVNMAASLANLLATPNIPAEEVGGSRHALLGMVDFTHPLFAPFADPRFSDFTHIYFWKHRRVNLDTLPKPTVLARFDDESPALFSVKAGRGQVFVLTSGWQPADSQFALSSKFVPLLYSFLEQAGTVTSRQAQFVVGDEVPVPTGAGVDAVWVKPDGTKEPLKDQKLLPLAELPGVYGVQDKSRLWRLAINLPPEESRTAITPVEELERLGVPVHTSVLTSPQQVAARREKLKHVELESRQKLWRWLLVAALVVLLIETWLAARLTRPVQTAVSS